MKIINKTKWEIKNLGCLNVSANLEDWKTGNDLMNFNSWTSTFVSTAKKLGYTQVQAKRLVEIIKNCTDYGCKDCI